MIVKEMIFKFSHIGINGSSSKEVENLLSFCQGILGFQDISENPLSFFVADQKIELMKEGGIGTLGHLAFYTPDIYAAIEYVEEKGFELDYSTARYEEDGKTIRLIYIKQEINGFAIHLTTRK